MTDLVGCATCALLFPRDPTIPGRRYCTRICQVNRHRWPRALSGLQRIVEAAFRSEELDRPELAEVEWRDVGKALERLQRMADRIQQEREGVGLTVPAKWPFVQEVGVEPDAAGLPVSEA